jgi:hypothetical protein
MYHFQLLTYGASPAVLAFVLLLIIILLFILLLMRIFNITKIMITLEYGPSHSVSIMNACLMCHGSICFSLSLELAAWFSELQSTVTCCLV